MITIRQKEIFSKGGSGSEPMPSNGCVRSRGQARRSVPCSPIPGATQPQADKLPQIHRYTEDRGPFTSDGRCTEPGVLREEDGGEVVTDNVDDEEEEEEEVGQELDGLSRGDFKNVKLCQNLKF